MNSSLSTLLSQLNERFDIKEKCHYNDSFDGIECDFKEELEKFNEDNSGLSGGEYETPNAFTKKEKEPEDDSYPVRVQGTDRFYKKMESIYNELDLKVSKLNEINYNDYRNDESRNEKQKINQNIIEINKKLREVEQMIAHASKLKTESGLNSDIFWKRTGTSFLKIKERLNRLTNKIVEISGN